MIKAKEKKLKIGVLGCGRMGRIRISSSIANGDIVSVIYDPDIDKVKEIKEKYSELECVTSLESFPWKNIDVVFICSPPKYHLHHTKMAISENTHFFIEKPLGLKADGFIPLIDIIQEKKLVNAVGYMNRYRNSIEECKIKLREKPPLGLTAYWVNSRYKVPWWSNIEESGGSFNEQATHLIDTCRYLLGEINSCKTYAIIGDSGLITSASVNMCFSNNCLANMYYSCEAKTKQIGIEIFTEEKKIALTDWDFKLKSSNEIEDKNQIFNKETYYFLKAVRDANSSLIRCTLEDAIKTQKIVDIIHTSIKQQNILLT